MERYNAFSAAKSWINSLRPFLGRSSSSHEPAAAEVLPLNYQLAWTGSTYQEKLTQGSSTLIFAMSVIMVAPILATQYEK
ncbi:hypothetical protein DSUL_50317 [Desulfovibrionales bacterium]